jgi:hypothetical protein
MNYIFIFHKIFNAFKNTEFQYLDIFYDQKSQRFLQSISSRK